MDPKNTLDAARPVEQSSSCIQFIKDNKWKIITGIAAVALAAIALALLLTPPGLIIGIGLSASTIAIIGLSSSCAGLVAASGFILAVLFENNVGSKNETKKPEEKNPQPNGLTSLSEGGIAYPEDDYMWHTAMRREIEESFDTTKLGKEGRKQPFVPSEIRVGIALTDSQPQTLPSTNQLLNRLTGRIYTEDDLFTEDPDDQLEPERSLPSKEAAELKKSASDLLNAIDEGITYPREEFEGEMINNPIFCEFTMLVENRAFDASGVLGKMKIRDALKYKKEPIEIEEKFPEDIGEMKENPAFDPAFNNYTQVRMNPAYEKFQECFVPPIMNHIMPKSQSGQILRPELTGVDEDMPKNEERIGRFSKKSLDEADEYVQKLKSEKQAELDKRAKAAALAKEIEDKRAKARAEFNSVD